MCSKADDSHVSDAVQGAAAVNRGPIFSGLYDGTMIRRQRRAKGARQRTSNCKVMLDYTRAFSCER